MKFTASMKLVRVSALPSALADVFGGVALAVFIAGRADLHKLPWLLLLTVGIYLGGMALNDVLHERKDRLLGKRRPIVTGEVSRHAARIVTLALFAAGVAGGFAAGAGVATLVLLALIVLYNVLAAGRVRGVNVVHPLWQSSAAVAVIAACRAIHVCLPALAITGIEQLARQPVAWVFAGSVFVYFCLVTTVSLFEDRGGGRIALHVVEKLLLLPVAALPAFLLVRGERPDMLVGIVLPALVILWMLFALHRALARARREPTPPNLGRAVGTGIRGEALLMAAFALMLSPSQPWWGLLALACYPAAKLLSRWVSPT